MRALFGGLTDADSVIVPEFCLLECTNVLWKQVRFHGLSPLDADTLVDDLNALPLTIHSTSFLLKRALEIGLNHQLAVYDSLYIALGEQLGYPLITDDARQARAAAAVGITLKPITDFQA